MQTELQCPEEFIYDNVNKIYTSCPVPMIYNCSKERVYSSVMTDIKEKENVYKSLSPTKPNPRIPHGRALLIWINRSPRSALVQHIRIRKVVKDYYINLHY